MRHITPADRHHIHVQHADAVIAAGLVEAFAREPDLVAVNGLADAADLIVCDFTTGLTLAQSARRSDGSPPTRVLVLTGQDREYSVRQALQSGVHGYLLTDATLDELLDATRTVLQGRRFVSPQLAARMADSMTREALTAREIQVLEQLATGDGNREVARRLGIATGTVKTHVNAIMTKLAVTSRTHAVSVAAQRGLVDLSQRILH
ncbi:MAG: response regulator transcription factor [Comamonadaceae bacterium]|nr:MAG: response regulator transcription factor [Comamonadaceae bacterium]